LTPEQYYQYPITHTKKATHSYLRGGDQEDHSSRQAQTKAQDPIQKITKTKSGVMSQVVEHLSSNHEILSSNPSITKREREREISIIVIIGKPYFSGDMKTVYISNLKRETSMDNSFKTFTHFL
jgi:hypothetical protein